ncbi:MAG: hypothetical protein ACRCZD_19075, partial [Phycicoccus sp.]
MTTHATRSTPTPSPPHATRLTRLADWSRRHHWTAIVVWLLVLAGTLAAAGAAGDDYRNDFSL